MKKKSKSKLKDFDFFKIKNEEIKGNLVKPTNDFLEFPREEINRSIVRRFEKQVEKYPRHIAVKGKEQTLAYEGLNALSNQVARAVCRSVGEKCGGAALLFRHDVNMNIAILGALKSGTFYIPLDPLYPPRRLAYMLKDSDAKIILTDRDNQPLAETLVLNLEKEIKILNISTLAGQFSTENLGISIAPEDFAYILYTSGSTGVPKGVIQNHRNVLHFIRQYTNNLHIHAHDRLTLFSSYCFDAAVMDIYGALLNGAALYPIDIKQENILYNLPQTLKEEKISIFHSIPTLYRCVTDILKESDELPDVQFIVLGGEAIFKKDVENYKKYFPGDCLFINGLGPTESTVTLQYFIDKKTELTKETVPVGFPVGETEVYLLGENQEEAHAYEVGEIVYKSEYLALGYLNNQEKTAEVFGPDPIKKTGRIYRSGDMGRRLPDGNIEFVGRKDFQVKVRGCRIELGEVEGKMDHIEGIKKSVVVCRQDHHGENYLSAYYTAEKEIDMNVIIKKLKEQLPDYMVPSKFFYQERFPLTLTGKIDRQALPEIEAKEEKIKIAPRDAVEEKLAQIWSEVLGIEKEEIGVESNFFDLGGQSINAIITAARIHKEFDVNIPIREIFQLAVLNQMAAYIKESVKVKYDSIEPREKKEYHDLSSAQKRHYFLQQMWKSTTYNISTFMRLEGDTLDPAKIESTFKKLINRHESLRTSFVLVGEMAVQRIHEPGDMDFALEYHEARNREQVDEIVNNFVKPFDMSQPPLLRAGLVKTGENQYVLMVERHHIVTDGFSTRILVNEFTSLYAGKELPPLRLQYRDFSGWQNRLLAAGVMKRQEEYWLSRFGDSIPVLKMPVDYPGAAERTSNEGDRLEFSINGELTVGIRNHARETGATIFMVLLAVYNILLSKYSGQEDIVVGFPVTGRRHHDLQNIFGMFVNMLAMRNQPAAYKSFKEFLEEVKKNALDAYENQDYQYEELVKKLNLQGNMHRDSLIDTVFTIRNSDRPVENPADLRTAGGLKIAPYEFKRKDIVFDLSLIALDSSGGLDLAIEYSNRLFKHSTVQDMSKHFFQVLEQVIEKPGIKLSEIKINSGLVAITHRSIDDNQDFGIY